MNKVRAGAPGEAIVGGFATGHGALLALSPDERHLYVASGQGGGGGQVPASPCTRTGDPLEEREGTILVMDVERAKSDPRSAVIGGIRAACGGGMAVSPDGAFLYLAERLGDSLLVFDAKAIATGDASALIARVPVIGPTSTRPAAHGSGAAATAPWTNWPGPTDVAVIDDGRRVVVKSLHHLTVIDAERVHRGADAILGTIPADAEAGQWGWMVVPTPDRKTLVVEVGSGLAIIDVDRLPLEPLAK